MVNKIRKKQNVAAAAPNKHIHSRVSYLFQAAQYLSAQPLLAHHSAVAKEQSVGLPRGVRTSKTNGGRGLISDDITGQPTMEDSRASMTLQKEPETKLLQSGVMLASPPCSLSNRLISHLRAISLKSQIRLSVSMKRSICKCCCALLNLGQAAFCRIENRSRGGRKPWADVLVVHCNACGTEKRFPVGASKQSRRSKEVQTNHPDNTKEISGLQD